MSLLVFVIQVCHSRSAIAAPVTNLTALATEIAPPWVSSSRDRGTWDLLYSCGFTILLCVYAAIHLNIPSPDDTKFTFWLRKTKWVAIAILAPEVVVYTAFEQWLHAKQFLTRLRKAASNSEDKGFKDWYSGHSSRKPFDMVYAYYVVMGGFVADIDHLHNSLKRVTTTPTGVVFMASMACIPRIKRSDIQDKSKADILAKGLVCVQVVWTVGQVIERKLASYPLTMLEVHTIVHVVCALLMYGLWIQKPLNVQDPTVIDFREDPELLGLMLQLSVEKSRSLTGFVCKSRSDPSYSPEPPMTWYKDLFNLDPLHVDLDAIGGVLEPHCLQQIKERPEICLPLVSEGDGQPLPQISTPFCLSSKDSYGVVHRYPMGSINWQYTPVPGAEAVCTIVAGQALFSGIGPSLPRPAWRSRDTPPPPSALDRPFYLQGEQLTMFEPISRVSLSQKDLKRLSLVDAWITKLPMRSRSIGQLSFPQFFGLWEILRTASCEYDNLELWSGTMVSRQAKNLAAEILGIGRESAYLATVLALLPAAYGSVHLVALDIVFPTAIEKLLWKSSCFILIGAAATYGFLGLVVYANQHISKARHVRKERKAKSYDSSGAPPYIGYQMGPLDFLLHAFQKIPRPLRKPIVPTFLVLFAIPYFAARIYLVVESFISLRYVPIGVYQTPSGNFISYIPHL